MRLIVDGQPIAFEPDDTLLAAMLRADLHPTGGGCLCLGGDCPHCLATVDGVAQHHERWDGHGYPFGLAGERISPLARIVTLADSFDAILSCRSYSEPMTSLRARAEIVRCTGSQFDPGVVDALFARMDRALDDPDRLVPVEVVTAGDLMGIDWTKLLLSPSPMTRAHAWT